jgi:hypothetical protein
VVPEALAVGLVVGEEDRRLAVGVEPSFAEERMRCVDDGGLCDVVHALQQRAFPLVALRPRVPEPERRQQVKRRAIRAPVVRGDAYEQLLDAFLRELHVDVEVAVVVEDAGVDQLVLGLRPASPRAGLDQVRIGEGRLRIAVQIPHPRVRGSAVEVVVVLLDVLAVIAFGVRQAEQSLLEDRVLPVPERQREAEELGVVGHAGDAVLAPEVDARSSVVVAEGVPGVAGVTVVLADRAPLAFAEVRSPASPRFATSGLLQALVLGAGEEARFVDSHDSCLTCR